MSGKRGERVAPPAGAGQYEVKYGCNEAGKGWEDLCQQAPTNALAAWEIMRTNPNPAVQTPRHGRLRHTLATGTYKGETYPQWQIEVTGGGRVWYLFDAKRKTCWIARATTGHPKETE